MPRAVKREHFCQSTGSVDYSNASATYLTLEIEKSLRYGCLLFRSSRGCWCKHRRRLSCILQQPAFHYPSIPFDLCEPAPHLHKAVACESSRGGFNERWWVIRSTLPTDSDNNKYSARSGATRFDTVLSLVLASSLNMLNRSQRVSSIRGQ